jgi:2-polyprenyl-3-methyl-5-hydroxy-6-metoxy-1,4-benzoquinol methylase
MSEVFNYNDVFMGAIPGKRQNYSRSFKDDYRLKRLTEAVTKKSGKMLDIGCGGGILTESLHYYYPKMKLYGCDVSKTAITYAKKFGSGRVTYGVIKDKKLPYRNNSMDVCVCLDVMEHIPDVEFFLKEVKRILKKNGQFFLLVPCEGQPFTFTWFFKKIKLGQNMTYKNWGHIHPEFTHKSVEKLLKKHGFSIKRKTYSEHFLYQTANFLMYFFPKEVMNFILKDKADKYTDRAMILDMKNKKKSFDIMIYIRNTWLYISRIVYFVPGLEIEAFKNHSFTAWKAHFLATVDSK